MYFPVKFDLTSASGEVGLTFTGGLTIGTKTGLDLGLGLVYVTDYGEVLPSGYAILRFGDITDFSFGIGFGFPAGFILQTSINKIIFDFGILPEKITIGGGYAF